MLDLCMALTERTDEAARQLAGLRSRLEAERRRLGQEIVDLGRRRTDLLIQWPGQRIVIVLKLLRGTLEKTVAEGMRQIAEYIDRSNATEAHLVIFDRRTDIDWDTKIYEHEEPAANGRPITIWGCWSRIRSAPRTALASRWCRPGSLG